jgi:Ca-activated chloride channel family protein
MRTPWLAAFAILAWLCSARISLADDSDSIASPYFQVDSDNPGIDQLPLKSTRVDVRVLGVIADVVVTQQYKNEGIRPIEARYVFPGSTRAAVYAMNVQLGERRLSAVIREKQQARAEYEAAKSAGKTAALLEQHRPNVFEMNVANILPGDDVQVELRYTELLVPTDNIYQFVFPTVVGPRYNNPASGSGTGEQWISIPYLSEGKRSATSFELNVDLATPIPVQAVASPSHKIEVASHTPSETHIQLQKTANENNRDFVLNFRLAGDGIQSGILMSRASQPGGENFFLAMVQPPRQVKAFEIVPREYIFIVDISGSMHGFPLDTTKALLRDLIGGLRPSDSFNVMLFAGSNYMLSPQSVPASQANIDAAVRALDNQMGGGGTELVPALRAALALPRDVDRARSFVVVTDGYVTVEDDIFQLIKRNLAQANLFAFGIGSSVNRELIEGMARAGQGEPFVVLNEKRASKEAERFRRMIDSPVLTHIQARFEGLEVYEQEPIAVPDVFAQRPVVLFGKWRGEPKGRLMLTGRAAGGTFRSELAVPNASSQGQNEALRYLWARHRIAALSDQEALTRGAELRNDILALGLQYNLLTQYTSFIAVDRIVRNPDPNLATTVDQPLPLPEGVSALAIGESVPSTPEPAPWMLLAVAGIALLVSLRRRAA